MTTRRLITYVNHVTQDNLTPGAGKWLTLIFKADRNCNIRKVKINVALFNDMTINYDNRSTPTTWNEGNRCSFSVYKRLLYVSNPLDPFFQPYFYPRNNDSLPFFDDPNLLLTYGELKVDRSPNTTPYQIQFPTQTNTGSITAFFTPFAIVAPAGTGSAGPLGPDIWATSSEFKPFSGNSEFGGTTVERFIDCDYCEVSMKEGDEINFTATYHTENNVNPGGHLKGTVELFIEFEN